MAQKPVKRPRDSIELAKLIGDIATGETVDAVEDGKNPAAVQLGRLGGQKGGRVRAAALSPQERIDQAKHAAKARWQIKAR